MTAFGGGRTSSITPKVVAGFGSDQCQRGVCMFKLFLLKIRHIDFHKTLVDYSVDSGALALKSNCCGVRCEKMRYKNFSMAAYVNLIVVSSQLWQFLHFDIHSQLE